MWFYRLMFQLKWLLKWLNETVFNRLIIKKNYLIKLKEREKEAKLGKTQRKRSSNNLISCVVSVLILFLNISTFHVLIKCTNDRKLWNFFYQLRLILHSIMEDILNVIRKDWEADNFFLSGEIQTRSVLLRHKSRVEQVCGKSLL